MARRGRERAGLIAALCAITVLGGATAAAGITGLLHIKKSHRFGEIFVTASPLTFQSWFAARLERDSSGDRTADDTDLVSDMAGRLLLMRLDQRFALVQAMMQDRFWSELTFNETNRQRALTIAEEGIMQALALSPGAGELWLMAAKVRTMRAGFDHRAARYLHASHVLSAGEGAVVRARFVFSTGLLPLLRGQAFREFRRDAEIVERLDPQLHELATWRLAHARAPSGAPLFTGSVDVPRSASPPRILHGRAP